MIRYDELSVEKLLVYVIVLMEDVGDQVGSFVGGGVMGLTVGHLFVGECVDIKLGSFVGTLLGLEDVSDRDGGFAGGGVKGLTVGNLLIKELVPYASNSARSLAHCWARKMSVFESAASSVAE